MGCDAPAKRGKMRPCLRTVVEAQNSSDYAIQFRGDMNGASAAAIQSAGRFVIQQLDVEGFPEIGYRARQRYGTFRLVGIADPQTILVTKLFYPLDVFFQSSPLRQKLDRKSTRLNSSHQIISYAVF